ncbi:hypothetical protein ACLH0K_04740 [Arthrobacter sp. MPF02]|uniref:hypothetical protein n=1 Tax=Arthrobacter sp. MPF02 TaxID=3388492 RepID=UPI003984903D
MTSSSGRQQQPRPDGERCVDELLSECGFTDDAQLRGMLLQLRCLGNISVPPPSPALAALLECPAAGNLAPLELGRRRTRKRMVFTTLAVAASLGVAGGAVPAMTACARVQRRQSPGSFIRSPRRSLPGPRRRFRPGHPTRRPPSCPPLQGRRTYR